MERIPQSPSKKQLDKEIVNQVSEFPQPEDLTYDTKTITEQFIVGNGIIWNRDDSAFLEKGSQCSSHIQKEEKRVDGENESSEPEHLNEDAKTFNEQFIDGNGDIWSRDDPGFLGNADSHSTKTEDNDMTVVEDDDVSSTPSSNQRRNGEEIGTYACIFDSCSYKTTTKKNLCRHLDFDHPNKFAKCGKCSFTSRYVSKIKSHFKNVHLSKYKCDLCDFVTNHKYYLPQHVSSVHGNKIFKCRSCEFVCNSYRILRDHMKNGHSKLKTYICHLCEYVCKQPQSLQRHIRSLHFESNDFKCDLCDYETNRKSNLDFHSIKVHSKSDKLKCQFCDFATHRKDYLKGHIDSVHLLLKNQKCHLCDFVTFRKDNLKNHIKKRHFQD